MLNDKTVLITGITGSLGKALVRRILSGEMGMPKKIIGLSRDEAKQHQMRVEYMNRRAVTDEVIYQNFSQRLEFRIGDVRDFHSVASALRTADIVFNAAAMKQVPTCEYFPYEAVLTNISGPQNICRAILEHNLPVELVIGISTDKACKPVNVMGMTKAMQERIFTTANVNSPNTRFSCVRYGNVLASRGSVVPLFLYQIRSGGPVTITTETMTRFLLSLEDAVDVVFESVRKGKRGETYIPRVPAALMVDLARVLIGDRKIETKVTGIRPGEKVHEILVSEEECQRTFRRDDYYVIAPILPELSESPAAIQTCFDGEYSSADNLISVDGLRDLLGKNGLLDFEALSEEDEVLR